MRYKRKFFLGLILSALFLYLAVRKVNFQEVSQALQRVNYLYIIPYVVSVLIGMWIRAYRWKYMVNPIKKIRLKNLFSYTMIGFMAINVLPFRIGEFVRAYSLGSKEKVSKSATMATILLERISDFIALLILVWFTLVFFQTPAIIKKIGNFTLLIIVGLILFLVFLKAKTSFTLSFLDKIFFFLKGSVLEKLKGLLVRFVSGLGVLTDFKAIFWILAISSFLWFGTAFSNYFIFLAFGLKPPIYVSFVVLIMVVLGVSLPAAPGFIGTFQFFCVKALSFFHIPESLGFSISVLLWLGNYLPITLLGLYYLHKEHLSLKEVQIEAENKEGF